MKFSWLGKNESQKLPLAGRGSDAERCRQHLVDPLTKVAVRTVSSTQEVDAPQPTGSCLHPVYEKSKLSSNSNDIQ